jgi:hypothetical protein
LISDAAGQFRQPPGASPIVSGVDFAGGALIGFDLLCFPPSMVVLFVTVTSARPILERDAFQATRFLQRSFAARRHRYPSGFCGDRQPEPYSAAQR